MFGGGREGGRLEEVVWSPPCDMRLPSSGCGVKLQAEKERKLVILKLSDGNLRVRLKLKKSLDLQGVLQCIVEFHYGCLVSATVTVVGSREYCYHISANKNNTLVQD